MTKIQYGFIPLLSLGLLFSGGCGLKSPSSSQEHASEYSWFVQSSSKMNATQLSQRITDYSNHIKSLSEKQEGLTRFSVASGIQLGTHGVSQSQIVVKFRDGSAESAVRQALSVSSHELYQFTSSGAKLVPLRPGTAPEEVIAHVAALKELAGVEYAYPDYRVAALATTPNDTLYEKQYGLNNTKQVINYSAGLVDADIDAPEAWEESTGSRSVTVAVIDSGVDYTHPDLAENIWSNPGETGTDSNGADKRSNGIDDDSNGYTDDFRGWDFVDNDNDPMDTHGHGTHVAGIIGAVGNNNRGVTGINWQVSIVPLRVLDAFGSGSSSDIKKAVEYATRMGFNITNNSYAGGGFDQSMKDAIEAAKTGGVLFVAASGNENNNNDTNPVYPASYGVENVITVGASNKSDTLAFFSNYGAISVHLVAPGEDILSTYLNHSYRYLSGSSMAAPHVAGAAALLKANDQTLTYSAIKTALISSVDVSSAFQTKTSSGGRLNLARAIGGLPSTTERYSPPTILMLSKTAGPLAGGTNIMIFGTGFRTGATVKIGQRSCSNASVIDTSEINCTLPSHRAGTYWVQVTNVDGQSAYSPFWYTYQSAPKLKLISPSRNSVASITAGKTLYLVGEGFRSGATITLGDSVCTAPYVYSSYQIACDLPTSLAIGTYSVKVTNPDGQSSSTLSLEVAAITARWVATQGGHCPVVCKAQGLETRPSPEGAYCTSGKIIPASAVGNINYVNGCSPNTSCVAQGPVTFVLGNYEYGAFSFGQYCFGFPYLQKYQATDITMGCFCGL